jgi:hypothetical protein
MLGEVAGEEAAEIFCSACDDYGFPADAVIGHGLLLRRPLQRPSRLSGADLR